MTQYSKNSRNMKAETVSNTGGNSGQGPTHPYSQHNDSASRYSESNQLHSEAPESPEDTFELAIQYIMPLVNAIKQENQHLKDQREQIQTEMTQLNKLSQDLLAENQQLRKHHSLRTQDIRKLIQTISINTQQEIGNINHQSFLLRQSNHAIVKRIESQMKAALQIQQLINKDNQELEIINQRTHLDQQTHRDLQIKNKQLFYRCEELKRQAQNFNSFTENDAVHKVLIQVVSLRNNNKQDLLRAKDLLKQHKEEQPFVQENHASVFTQNKQLNTEEQELRATVRATDKKLQELKIAYNQSVQRFTDSFRSYQRAKNSLTQDEQELIKIKSDISESKAKAKKKQLLRPLITQEKKTLNQKILERRQAIKMIQEGRMQIQEKLASQTKIQVNKLKKQLNNHTSQINEEIAKKISPELAITSNAIAQAKEEYAQLVQEVQQLRQSVQKIQNPRKEIIRLEYQLKKLSYKKK